MPKKTSPLKRTDNPIAIRVYMPGAVMARLETYMERLTAASADGRPVTRTDTITALVVGALAREGA